MVEASRSPRLSDVAGGFALTRGRPRNSVRTVQCLGPVVPYPVTVQQPIQVCRLLAHIIRVKTVLFRLV